MKRAFTRVGLAGAVSLAALLVVGVTAAGAHGGPGGPGFGGGFGGASVSSLVTEAAKQLNVSRAKLVTGIEDAAAARIDAAVASGDVTSDQADDLKAEAQDNVSVAYRISETATVASKLGISTTALNDGFRAARKALLTARIDKALAAGVITSDEAAQLKSRVASATLPGYKAGFGFGGFGPGFGAFAHRFHG